MLAAAYAALQSRGKVYEHRLLAYRCEERCLLLDVLNFPQGVVFHSPGYKLSAGRNAATSTASGRSRNTTDGTRRWKSQTRFSASVENVQLACDHITARALARVEVQADLDAGHTEVIVIHDGQRVVR